MPPLDQRAAQAQACLQAGQMAQAEFLFLQLTKLAPGQPGYWHGLGLSQQGEAAVQSLRRAAKGYRSALERGPDLAAGATQLGHALLRAGQAAEARGVFAAVVKRLPAHAEAHANLANALCLLGQHEAADAACVAALALQPGVAALWRLRADVARLWGNRALLVECRRAVCRLLPADAQALFELGEVLSRTDPEEAAAILARVLVLRPEDVAAAELLAGTWVMCGRFAEAEAMLRRMPQVAGIKAALGMVLMNLMRLDEAATLLREAMPDAAIASVTLGHVRMLQGDYAAGFALMEQRFAAGLPARAMAAPVWRGEALATRTLLVHAEQGFGDTLLFCRFMASLRARAPKARLVLSVQAPLAGLLAGIDGADEVVAETGQLPPHDVQVPLLSVPALLGTDIDTLPAAPAYIQADAALVAGWRDRLAAVPGLKVGLCWAGNREQVGDRTRSVPEDELAPLLALGGVSFVSLQQFACALPGVLDVSSDLTDFRITAALMASLDLVIAADTAVLHLAGALGRPVWLLNRFNSFWPWPAGQARSPWYPRLRIFTQAHPGDWESVIDAVGAALVRQT